MHTDAVRRVRAEAVRIHAGWRGSATAASMPRPPATTSVSAPPKGSAGSAHTARPALETTGPGVSASVRSR